MYIEILLAVVLGIISGITAGIITGLTPGIHINLISIIVVSSSAILLRYTSPISLGCFIIAMAVTHTFLDAIPGIYLGAPDESQALNVLPGHRLLLQGKGHDAVVCTIIGSMFCLLLTIFSFPLIIKTMKITYPLFKEYVGYALLVIIVLLILREKTIEKRVWSFVMFFSAGVLGFIVLNFGTLKQPLFHLLSGLFGISILLLSLFEKSKIPDQHFSHDIDIDRKVLVKATIASTIVGFLAGFLPGFGSSQAAIAAQQFVGEIGDKGFLVLVGGINTVNMLVSIATMYTLEKGRNGAIIAVGNIVGTISFNMMILFLLVSLIVCGTAVVLSLKISRLFAVLISKVHYASLVGGIMMFIVFLTLYFDGLMGLLILITATSLGLTASLKQIGKNHLMGCLIIPVIVYFVF